MASVANQQDNSSWNKPIDSVDRVIEAIQYLNMPLPAKKNIVVLSSSQEKGKFKESLELCLGLKGRGAEQDVKKYVFGMVSCLADDTFEDLAKLGYKDVPPDLLVGIGASNGMAFRAALTAAITPASHNQDLGMTTVGNMLFDASKRLDIAYTAPTNTSHRTESSQQQAQPEAAPEHYQQPDEMEDPAPASDWLSTHVYAGKAGLCFNAAKSKDKANHTVIVDAALAKGERQYDWPGAIKIQLGHKELPLLYGVLAGWRKSVKFSSHGAQNDKSLEIERQEKNFFVKVNAKGEQQRAVPINSQDAYPLMLLVFTQIMRQVPDEMKGKHEIVLSMMRAAQSLDSDITGNAK